MHMIHGTRIMVARQALGLSVARMARMMGVERTDIEEWEAKGVEIGEKADLLSIVLRRVPSFFREEPIAMPPILGHQDGPARITDGESCASCFFYAPRDTGTGKVCRAYPIPTESPAHGWCGDWEAIEWEA